METQTRTQLATGKEYFVKGHHAMFKYWGIDGPKGHETHRFIRGDNKVIQSLHIPISDLEIDSEGITDVKGWYSSVYYHENDSREDEGVYSKLAEFLQGGSR